MDTQTGFVNCRAAQFGVSVRTVVRWAGKHTLKFIYFQTEMEMENRLLLEMIFEMKVFDIVK